MTRGDVRLRAVLFDRGGTLLHEFPEVGAAADGPRAEAIPGAEEALRALHGKYTLAVATNGRPWVTPLDCYFNLVVTAPDLGVAKPDPAFFRAILERLALAPGEAAMVGDAYEVDIVGAKTAGLRAIWFNPAGTPCPTVHPVHDAEVRAMVELPALLERRWRPDIADALRILHSHGVPPNIVRHSLAVAAVAHRLALRLREQGTAVDPLLVHRGGLLHDLDKVSSEKPADHGVKAERALRELGWPDLAAIAARHVLGRAPRTWEEKLVHYADKIVEEDEVVGLVARVTSLSCRYASDGDRIARSLPQLLALEQEIMRDLPTPPDAIMAELRALDLRLPAFVTAAALAYDLDRWTGRGGDGR